MSGPGFEQMSALLQEAGQDGPCLVLDLDSYHRNITLARERVQAGVGIRVVAKSLACLPMLDLACDGLGAVGLMTFTARMLCLLLRERPQLDHLLGKPLPVSGAASVLAEQTSAADKVIWLIDTAERAGQYAELAAARGQILRVALEVDVGLHRGGVVPDRVAAEIAAIRTRPALRLEGVMGYEPHLAKLPGLLRRGSRQTVVAALQAAAGLVQSGGGGLVNTGGSTSFSDYGAAQGVTEVSLGSVLVKPTDFDLPSTEGFTPAMFVATPILKYLPHNPVPGLDRLRAVTNLRRKADIAIYGGFWKARPAHPAGFGYSGVFGRSSNQEVWSGPLLDRSPVDQFAFLRPTQSEAILPEFGEVIVVSGGAIVDTWPCLPVAQ